jgi:hypothetical protein
MTAPAFDPIHLSIPDACKRHAIGRSTLYNLLAAGHVRAKKAGASTLVVVASLDRYFDDLPDAAYLRPRVEPQRRAKPQPASRRRPPTLP